MINETHLKLALKRAGVPSRRHKKTLRRIARALGNYDDRITRPKASIKTLGKVIRTVDKLDRLIKSLPHNMRESMSQLLEIQTREDTPLKKLIARAEQLQAIARKRPGRPRDALDGLLCDLFEIWREVMPDHKKPITQDNCVDGGYKGPLLDLAQDLLTAEKIKFKSRGMLGLRLSYVVRENLPAVGEATVEPASAR